MRGKRSVVVVGGATLECFLLLLLSSSLLLPAGWARVCLYRRHVEAPQLKIKQPAQSHALAATAEIDARAINMLVVPYLPLGASNNNNNNNNSIPIPAPSRQQQQQPNFFSLLFL